MDTLLDCSDTSQVHLFKSILKEVAEYVNLNYHYGGDIWKNFDIQDLFADNAPDNLNQSSEYYWCIIQDI